MQSTRAALRFQRVIRSNGPAIHHNIRFASEHVAPKTSGGGMGAVTGGLVGGGAALAVTYAWYHFSGAKSAVQTAQQAKEYLTNATDSLKIKFEDKTPDTNEAIQTLRETANKYASFVPGGRGYVDAAFDDLESVRKKHGDQVDNIVREAYGELRDVPKNGLSLETVSSGWDVLSKHLERLASLAGDASEDILNNHPQLKEKLGGSADQLKQLGERLGPEAKKQVDETWSQINDIVKQGVSVDSIAKVKKLVEDKTQKMRQMGEQAFNQGFEEQIKPMLDDNPKIKQLVEENMDTLNSGNVAEIYEKVKSAVSSGSSQDLEGYIEQARDKTRQFSSSQLTKWLDMIPNGSQIIPQLQKLREVAEKQGAQAEELAKETISEIETILDKKSKMAEELVESGKDEVKK